MVRSSWSDHPCSSPYCTWSDHPDQIIHAAHSTWSNHPAWSDHPCSSSYMVRSSMQLILHGQLTGSFSIYEQPKWERIVASTKVGFRVSIWVRIRVWIRVRVRVRIRVRVRVRVRLGLYFCCSYIEKGPFSCSGCLKFAISTSFHLPKWHLPPFFPKVSVFSWFGSVFRVSLRVRISFTNQKKSFSNVSLVDGD